MPQAGGPDDDRINGVVVTAFARITHRCAIKSAAYKYARSILANAGSRTAAKSPSRARGSVTKPFPHQGKGL
ncbi:hypothetical protein [Streptomyces sp. NPDC002540]